MSRTKEAERAKEARMAVQDPEEYEEAMERFLALIPPEKRLAGLTPEQVALALAVLPAEVLRFLPEDYLATVPEATRAAINKRLGR
jgi:hypothetical protein